MGTSGRDTLEEWLKFFQDASIPKNFTENYAVTFAKHQMKLDMLPDISKEHLLDMGITLVGHIIAILRHAKTVHSQTVTRTTLSQCPTVPMKKMPAEFKTTGVQNDCVPNINVSESHVNNKIVSQTMVKANTIVKLNPSQTSLPVSEVKKIRKVTPEQEGSYRIKMPSGNTQRSREILAKKKFIELEKKPVFERLGMETSVSSSTGADHDDQTARKSAIKCSKNDGEGVFSRLGTRCQVSSSEDVSEGPVSKPLPYIGVLKSPISPRSGLKRPAPSSSLYNQEKTLHSDNIVLGPSNFHVNKRFLLNPAAKQNPNNWTFTTSNKSTASQKITVKDRLGVNKSEPPKSHFPYNNTFNVNEKKVNTNTNDAKRVSFGTVSEQLIPKIGNKVFRNINEDRAYMDQAKPQKKPYMRNHFSNKNPPGMAMGTGVFKRLG